MVLDATLRRTKPRGFPLGDEVNAATLTLLIHGRPITVAVFSNNKKVACQWCTTPSRHLPNNRGGDRALNR
jgi:hypothetical protein